MRFIFSSKLSLRADDSRRLLQLPKYLFFAQIAGKVKCKSRNEILVAFQFRVILVLYFLMFLLFAFKIYFIQVLYFHDKGNNVIYHL